MTDGRQGDPTVLRMILGRQMPPGQLTTSELAREIMALEAAVRNLPADTHGQHGGRLEALRAERAERNHLAAGYLQAAQRHFPDGAS